MDTSMRWSPSLSAVLSGGKVCSIQDLFPRRPPSVGRGGALPPADRPQRGGAIPSGGRSVRLGSPRRPPSVGSPPFPGRTWWWWRRYSKPAKAWAAQGGDRWPSPVGLMARNNNQDFVELNVSTCGATDATAEVLTAVANSQAEGNLVRRLEISFIRRRIALPQLRERRQLARRSIRAFGPRDLWRPSQRQARALPKRIAGN